MAVSFRRLYPTMYTWELQTINIDAPDGGQVEFSIWYYLQPTQTIRIFRTTYYAEEGGDPVEVIDVASIMEAFMRQRSLAVGKFQFRATNSGNTATEDVLCVFCKQRNNFADADVFLADYFLTTHTSRLLPMNADINLAFYVETDGNITTNYSITYQKSDGTTAVVERNSTRQYRAGVREISPTYSYLFNLLNAPDCERILSVLITMGNRTARIYFTPQTDLRMFWFMNAFNCAERAYFSGKRVMKTETKSSLAVLNDTKSQYDVQYTRTFVETSSQLTFDEARWLLEMLTSPEVWIEDCGTDEGILITDYKAEITDENGAGNSIEFEWEYAKMRPLLPELPHRRVFSQEYNNVFA